MHSWGLRGEILLPIKQTPPALSFLRRHPVPGWPLSGLLPGHWQPAASSPPLVWALLPSLTLQRGRVHASARPSLPSTDVGILPLESPAHSSFL